jgi:DNA-directed RNA polymerase specialized sigma24 family protein
LSDSAQANGHQLRGGRGHLAYDIAEAWGTYIMPGRSRDNRDRLPDFYLSPSVKERPIDPEVRSAMEQLWPWFWGYVGGQLGDPDRAADLAEVVAYRVSGYLKSQSQVRSLGGLCRVAAMHFVASTKAKERRIEFRGLSQEIEGSLAESTSDWQEVELWIWVHQILQGQDREISLMLQLRVLGKTWDEVGKSLGLSGGQARLRFWRALRDIFGDRGGI